MLDVERAWLAGIFDGEGCVWCRYPKRKNLVIEIKMSDRLTLERIQELFPGRLARGCLSRGSFSKKPQWKWSLDTRKSVLFLDEMLEFLVTKRNHAIAARAYARAEDNEDRKIFAAQLKALNA